MEQEKKPFVSYPLEGADAQPVVSIGGREYRVVPMAASFAVSQRRIDFAESHGQDGLGLEINQQVEHTVADIVETLYRTAAFTVAEDTNNGLDDVRSFAIYVPVLLPVDGQAQWNFDSSDEATREYVQAIADRRKTGRPHMFKIVEYEEDGE